jgi:hypothetical protein
MIIENLASQLEDIFNIPRDGSNIKDDESQETAYADALLGNSNVSFEKKAAELNSKLSKIPTPVTEEIEYGSEPLKNDSAKTEELKPEIKESPEKVKLVTEVSNNEKESKGDMANILAQAIPTTKSQPVVNISLDNEQASDDKTSKPVVHEESKSEVRTQLPNIPRSEDVPEKEFIGIENEDDWLLESPSPRYSHFYDEKKRILPRLLRGGKLPIEKFSNELKQIKINTQVDMYDHFNIANKMTEIRQWQTRVMEIRGRVLSQYHSWKRSVVLFQGLLARAEYSKPAICQEGTNYNHMRDMELYLTDLEYLHDFTKEMLANLESQFESLSRQVTLSMPLKTIERYEEKNVQVVHPVEKTVPQENVEVKRQPVEIKREPSDIKRDFSDFDSLDNRVKDEGSSSKKSNNNKESTPKKATGWGVIK